MSKKTKSILALVIIFPMLTSLACLSSVRNLIPDRISELFDKKAEEVIDDAIEQFELEEPLETEEPAVVTEEVVTEEVPPEESPTEPLIASSPQDLILLEKSTWFQDEDTVFVAYLFENPNTTHYFKDSEFNFFFLNSNGVELGSEMYSFPTIYPGQTIAIVFTHYLSDDQATVDSMSVEWDTSLTQAPADMADPFYVNQVNYWDNSGIPMVTGGIINPSPVFYTDLRVSMICYNSMGEIVGGSYSYIDYLMSGLQAGFSSYVDTFGQVATVEAYAIQTYSTKTIDNPDIWSKISILEENFFQGFYDWVYGGVIIQNDTPDVLENSIFSATFYDNSGKVISVGAENIDYLLPGDTLGFAPWVYSLPEDTSIASYEVWILPGDVVNDFELTTNPFTVTATELVGNYNDTVSVTFKNNYTKSVSEVDVFVLLRNAQGEIIGGGDGWTSELTPAGGSATIEIWVSIDSSEEIASLEAWVMPSFWTNFE